MNFRLNTLLFSLVLLMMACAPKNQSDTTTADVVAATGDGIPFKVDAPRSKVKWTAYKPTNSHYGTVPVSGGSIFMQNNLVTGGTVEMDLTNLQVLDLEGDMKQKLEGHLKGTTAGKEDDFFNTQQFPTATFKITGSSQLDSDPSGTHLIQGDLTMKGITKPVSFKARLDTMAEGAVKVTTAPFEIDRTEWNIKFMSKKFFDNLKDDFVEDRITLELEIGLVAANQM